MIKGFSSVKKRILVKMIFYRLPNKIKVCWFSYKIKRAFAYLQVNTAIV